jgi:TPP-dependent indolepyruvate ferredoxin oxidoreductase alpha subunit
MAIVNASKCIGCRKCVKFCTVDAIEFDKASKKAVINQRRCTECYVCYRMGVCSEGAIEVPPIPASDFFHGFQHVMSDPVENHGVTGVTGRGTEEVKTNDVTGRVKKGYVGFSIDMGRPGLGVYLRDAEKVAMAMAVAGVEFEPPENTPLSALMTDIKTGKLDERCLDYHLLSVIVEGSVKAEKLADVLRALQKVEKEIETVFSLGLIIRVDENGQTPILTQLDEVGVPRPYRGKVNVGLGKPLSLA